MNYIEIIQRDSWNIPSYNVHCIDRQKGWCVWKSGINTPQNPVD